MAEFLTRCALPARNFSLAFDTSLRWSEGWTERPDLVWTSLLSSLQLASRVGCKAEGANATDSNTTVSNGTTTVGEIGVHHGSYFSFLAVLSLPGERLFVNDIFEAGQPINYARSGKGSLKQLIAATRRSLGAEALDVASRLTVVRASSLRLFDGDVERALRADRLPPFRLLSLDGDHTDLLSFSDLRWASSRLADGGVLAYDDLFNPNWLGASRGLRAFHHLLDRGYSRLRPLLLTAKKLYLTTPSHHAEYLAALGALGGAGGAAATAGEDGSGGAAAAPAAAARMRAALRMLLRAGMAPRVLQSAIGRDAMARSWIFPSAPPATLEGDEGDGALSRRAGGPLRPLSVHLLGRLMQTLEPAWNGTGWRSSHLLADPQRTLPPPGLPAGGGARAGRMSARAGGGSRGGGVQLAVTQAGWRMLHQRANSLRERGGHDPAIARGLHLRLHLSKVRATPATGSRRRAGGGHVRHKHSNA